MPAFNSSGVALDKNDPTPGYEEALRRPAARPFDMTGRPMKGWVGVDPEGYATEERLEEWIRQGVEFAASLPAK